jgi:hemerythrin
MTNRKWSDLTPDEKIDRLHALIVDIINQQNGINSHLHQKMKNLEHALESLGKDDQDQSA